MARISSGIPGFDSLVQGGFKAGSVNLIAGNPGAGKTIFSIQFLLEGLKRGEPGLYVTFEEKKDKLYEDMLSFGWDLAKYENQGKFIFLEHTPEQVKKILVEGGGTVESLVHKLKAKRIVIDSITAFTLLYKDELTKKEASLALFELISKWGCTAVMTSEAENPAEDSLPAALQFEVDSIIILYYTKRKGIRTRSLEVIKMRGTKHPLKTFETEITPHGFVVYPQRLVKF